MVGKEKLERSKKDVVLRGMMAAHHAGAVSVAAHPLSIEPLFGFVVGRVLALHQDHKAPVVSGDPRAFLWEEELLRWENYKGRYLSPRLFVEGDSGVSFAEVLTA